MTTVTLYTGGGVSFSPLSGEGRTVSACVRLVADEGRGITDGQRVLFVADVRKEEAGSWYDCDAPEEPETDPTAEEASEILFGGDAE